jgi:hypothetical protein
VGTAAVSYYYSEAHEPVSRAKRSISPFGVGPNKKKPKSVFVTLTLFFFSFGPCLCFQSTRFIRDFREAKRPRELRIQDSSERMHRQETRELRIQSPEDFILFYFFSFVVGHNFIFFFFCFLNSKKILSLYIMLLNKKI